MIIILMGVCGVGKTTVGQTLSTVVHGEFIDADDYHSVENKEKMRQGIALTDEERGPWLGRLNEELHRRMNQSEEPQKQLLVVACSALREVYRTLLVEGIPAANILWVHLKGEEKLIRQRMQNRPHAYMPVSLLESQFEILEEPQDALVIDVSQRVTNVVAEIVGVIELRRG